MSYWEGKGKYQDLSDELSKFIPDEGRCTDTRLELYRCACNLYYEIMNNGGINLDISDENIAFLHYERIETPTLNRLIDIEDKDMLFEEACEEMEDIMDQVILKARDYLNEMKEEGKKL